MIVLPTKDDILTSKIFFNAVLPLVKVIATDIDSLSKKFKQTHAVVQVSALSPDAPEGKVATHFVINSGEWLVHTSKVTKKPHIELEFKSIEAFNAFFKGKISPSTLPKMRGITKKPGTFIAFMQVLLKMSSLLSTKKPPEDHETKKLLVKCFFYLLSSGISQLNKNEHDAIHDWAKKSPDRVYAWAVDGYPEVSSYLRTKAGKSKAGRGEYKRAMPFFTLRFNSLDSALGILLSIDDMLEATKAGRLIMDGAPEFGAQIGEYMLTVSGYAQG